ncbi:hypothetical protein Goklo_023490 [Gossypium klotzschianum]|uniref:Uncharacterized protein n=1 Tax=Gossypium klotzschianum TaxID=34286 RepID=A0A7J8TR20_9ROSI|nr:hypothetical protein [Gossypium klotzschianum]
MTGLKCFISTMETKSWCPIVNDGLLMFIISNTWACLVMQSCIFESFKPR